MRPFKITLGIICAVIAGGAAFYWTHPAAAPVSPPAAVEPVPGPTPPAAPSPEAAATEERVLKNTNETVPAANVVTTSPEVKPPASTNVPATTFSRAIATLMSPQASFPEKQAAWKQLRKAGKLDEAVAALKQGVADHPTSPEYSVTLGETYIEKLRSNLAQNGDPNQTAVLGLQADSSFNAALKIDPANWEAQFAKAASMAHWPPEMGKGDEVIQRLSTLIDQQETMTPHPVFAQTYALLGDQYMAAGKPDYAEQTWKLGLAKFPADATLLKKFGNPAP